MQITEALLRQMMPHAGSRLDPHIPYINPALEWGKIFLPADVAAFLAHLAHESGEYRYMEEIADGSAYDQRTDLGNTPELDGDGQWFKGHGPIQITGRAAHYACGLALGIDLIKNPKLLTLPKYGTLSAAWFWTVYKPALQPASIMEFFHVTQRLVNGGDNGWIERVRYYQNNRALLGLLPYVYDQEAVRIADFQRAHGLMADGIAGRNTLAALAATGGTT